MFLTSIIAFLSLIGLIILHELGHFFLAKKFGVRVEEFGIGLPPRLFGRKWGETLYSINLLLLGGFVKIYGEDEKIEDSRSFSQKPIWQRALIIFGGVASFWIIAVVLLSIVMGMGTSMSISDDEEIQNAKVQIIAVASNSPAEISGIKVGDVIKKIQTTDQSDYKSQISKIKEIQEFTKKHKGKEIILTIERGKEIFDVQLFPRIEAPKGQGAMGVGLVRTVIKSYPWYQAPIQGLIVTGNLTFSIIKGFYSIFINLFNGLPAGVQVIGPIGIFSMFGQVTQLGINYFIQFIAIIALHLAIINLLPIPALDGGKLVFLGIEALRRKPVLQKTEQTITALFFFLLILLMIWITIKDIIRLFKY